MFWKDSEKSDYIHQEINNRLNSEKPYFHSLWTVLSFGLLSTCKTPGFGIYNANFV